MDLRLFHYPVYPWLISSNWKMKIDKIKLKVNYGKLKKNKVIKKEAKIHSCVLQCS